MIRVALCDDVSVCNKKLENLLDKYAKKNGIEIKTDLYVNGVDLLAKYCKRKYDILFLDIAMPQMDGYEVAKKIRDVDYDIPIVFCTSFYNFSNAQRGYDVRAKDFLKKPVSYNKIESILNKVYKKKLNAAEERFIVRTRTGFMAIQLSDIILFKSKNKITNVYTVNGEFCIHSKLYKLEEKLGDNFFCRCHCSYLVNLDYVDGLKDNCLLLRRKTESKIPISKYRKEQVMEQLAFYIGEQLSM